MHFRKLSEGEESFGLFEKEKCRVSDEVGVKKKKKKKTKVRGQGEQCRERHLNLIG